VIRPVDVKGSARMKSSGGWTARLSASMRRTSSKLEKRMARGLSWYLDIVRLKRTGRVEGYEGSLEDTTRPTSGLRVR